MTLPAAGETVARDHRGPGIVDRAIVVDKAQFTAGAIERVAHEFVAQNAKQKVLLRLTVGTDHDELMASLTGSPNNTYEKTKRGIETVGLPKQPIAQVWARGGAVVLRYRDAGGYWEKLLSGGADPTRFVESGVEFQLLHFQLFEAGAAVKPERRYSIHLYLLVRPKMSIRSAMGITRRLYQLTGLPLVSVSIRQDRWFIEDPAYPLVYRFTEPIELPNDFQYTFGPRVGCIFDAKTGLGCSGQNFSP
jgi:hypothetical protein